MTKLEQLANDVAMLSNDSLNKLATILVNEYPSRADSLQNFLCWAEFDTNETEEA
jgi:hypothetical protein